MKQENWINDVLESTKGMHKAEPSPFLFEQVTSKIKSGNAKSVYSSHGNNTVRWGLAVLVSVIISVNVISIVKSNIKTNATNESSAIGSNNELNNATIYSY